MTLAAVVNVVGFPPDPAQRLEAVRRNFSSTTCVAWSSVLHGALHNKFIPTGAIKVADVNPLFFSAINSVHHLPTFVALGLKIIGLDPFMPDVVSVPAGVLARTVIANKLAQLLSVSYRHHSLGCYG